MTFRGTTFRVKTRALLPWMLRKHGITLGRTVLVAGDASMVSPQLLAHEFAHVRQWEELGVVGFVWRYARELVTHGYGLKMPLEREAFAYATRVAPEFQGMVEVLRRVA